MKCVDDVSTVLGQCFDLAVTGPAERRRDPDLLNDSRFQRTVSSSRDAMAA